MMRSFITASNLALIAIILSACTQEVEEPPAETDKPKSPESLLLPEHRDTTPFGPYQPLPDSTLAGLNYVNPERINGTTYNRISFKHLSNVTVTDVPMGDEGGRIMALDFSEEVAALDRQKVVLRGFLLPISHVSNLYILSAFPYSQCFFCNNAGIETVMELKLKRPLPKGITMDQIVTVTGELELAYASTVKLPYTLNQTEIVAFE